MHMESPSKNLSTPIVLWASLNTAGYGSQTNKNIKVNQKKMAPLLSQSKKSLNSFNRTEETVANQGLAPNAVSFR